MERTRERMSDTIRCLNAYLYDEEMDDFEFAINREDTQIQNQYDHEIRMMERKLEVIRDIMNQFTSSLNHIAMAIAGDKEPIKFFKNS